MEPTQFDFIFGFYPKLRIKCIEVVFTYLPSFLIWNQTVSIILIYLERFGRYEFSNGSLQFEILI
jgi:hypothetical protein